MIRLQIAHMRESGSARKTMIQSSSPRLERRSSAASEAISAAEESLSESISSGSIPYVSPNSAVFVGCVFVSMSSSLSASGHR